MDDILLLSIKPIYAARIFRGLKRFEFRRRLPRRGLSTVLVYVSRPVGKLVGVFTALGTVESSVGDLWETTSEWAGLPQDEFHRYFFGVERASAIRIGTPRLFSEAFPLSSLIPGIRPPQSFRYVRPTHELSLLMSSSPQQARPEWLSSLKS